MTNKLFSCVDEAGNKRLPAWLSEDNDLSRVSQKNMKHYLRSVRYYRKLFDATGPWTDMKKIKFIYEMCRQLNEIFGFTDPNDPRTFVVDHIVPVSSEEVCGLNVHWNLQIITVAENNAKSNKWWPGMWERQISFLKPVKAKPGDWLDQIILDQGEEECDPQLTIFDQISRMEQQVLL